jgi:hypothetical protein
MSTIKADTLSNLAGTQTIPVSTVAQGTARAWVNFNGTGTVAIRASFNVSSITDGGVGIYTVNFTTAMPDANYSLVTGIGHSDAPGANVGNVHHKATDGLTTTSAIIYTVNFSAAASDRAFVHVSIFR